MATNNSNMKYIVTISVREDLENSSGISRRFNVEDGNNNDFDVTVQDMIYTLQKASDPKF